MALSTTFRARRRVTAWVLLASLALSIAAYAAAPAERETFRIVRIRGRRVHLRRGVPPQLTHDNVIRHLRNEEVLVADRVGYGIDYDGSPNGSWYHVVDLDNGECGWVNMHFVDILVTEEPEKKAVATTEPLTDSSRKTETRQPLEKTESQPIHDNPPADLPNLAPPFIRRYGDIAAFAAAAANVAMLVLYLIDRRKKGNVTPPSQSFNPGPHRPRRSNRQRNPNFIYGVAGGRPYRVRTTNP
ncbi:MAG TPA: hypothetical protein VGD79_07315 [Thermoanaerobaculia bacterium]